MKTKAPADRRKFADAWDEIGHLRDKAHFWLYAREDAARARPYADRLARLLLRADPKHEAILGEESWSLVHAARGNLSEAIKFRAREIQLIRQLHELTHAAPFQDFARQGYGCDTLRDHTKVLALLYRAAGQTDQAAAALVEAKRACALDELDLEADDEAEHVKNGAHRRPSKAKSRS